MNDKIVVKLVLIVSTAFVAAIIAVNYFSFLRETVIQNKKTEQVEMIQDEKTLRTEERSKFWNKIVPWNDKAPDSELFDSTEFGVQQ